MSWLPPSYDHHHPALYSPPFTRLPSGVAVWERSWNSQGWAACDEAHLNRMEPHPCHCLNAERASPRETGSSPCMHAGVHVGPGREHRDVCRQTRGPDDSAAVIRPSGQDAGPTCPVKHRGPRGWRSCWRAPDQRGEHMRPPDYAPYLDPSFRSLPLLHKPCSTTRTPDPLFILDTLFYYFCSIKASPRPDATPTV